MIVKKNIETPAAARRRWASGSTPGSRQDPRPPGWMTGTLLAAGLRPGTGRAACGRRPAAIEVSVAGKTSTVVGSCPGVDCVGDGKA